VLRTGPYRFYFWSHELNEPPISTWIAKSSRPSLAPAGCARSQHRVSGHELRQLQALVVEHQAEFLEAWHGHFGMAADERVARVEITDDTLSVALMDGRTISVPLVWYPRLFNATGAQRQNWEIAGGGYGIHWPDIDEDLSTEGCSVEPRAPAAPAQEEEQERLAAPQLTRGGTRSAWPLVLSYPIKVYAAMPADVRWRDPARVRFLQRRRSLDGTIGEPTLLGPRGLRTAILQ